MSQSYNQTVRNTFNKGLITEFSELNFPEEASTDELNCTLFKAGNRSKRLGVNYENNYELGTTARVEGVVYSTFEWVNVGNDPDVELIGLQTNDKILFYNKASQATSADPVSVSATDPTVYELNMTQFNNPGGGGAGMYPIEATTINGYLVIASPSIKTFYIERDKDTLEFTTGVIKFRVRDFKWHTDTATLLQTVNEEDVSLHRIYDTYNTGWNVSTDKGGADSVKAFTRYKNKKGKYPNLTHPWFTGREEGGDWDENDFDKVYSGNSLTANGHYILDLFNKNREEVSGIAGLNAVLGSQEDTTNRFSAVASFSGRVFYSGVDSRVYFSQILEDSKNFGNCFQQNDPTAEYLSDLLDTDGGYIRIPEAQGISKLHVFGSSLFVFASNGVWRISGVDDVFRATEYSVFRITDIGLAGTKSFVVGENSQPFWWSRTGIHSIQVSDQGGFSEVNISKDTIQTFFNNINPTKRLQVVSCYDKKDKKIIWMYPSDTEEVAYKFNKLLILDTDIGAFYPWSIEDKTTDSPYITGVLFSDAVGSIGSVYTIVDSAGNTVVDSSGNELIVDRTSVVAGPINVKLVVRDPDGFTTFGEFNDTTFYDWGTENYEAYAESAYNFIGDLTRKKNSPYITVFCRRTESEWVEQDDGSFLPDRVSGLKVSAHWDFKNTSAVAPQQAYRMKRTVFEPTEAGVYNYYTTVITTRLKLRGRGRSIKIRFEAEEGKDFNLLGWETIDAINRTF